ncbi:MAG TPA: RNA-binding domain-containing protein, partial [Candidatus Bathyarchaeia archaeon]|nr:RNA-binding domain-containing protein [Candidatus Bathyarchaeia archaeon]
MKLKESETLELKKSTSELKEAIVSIVAILNKHSRGGLYFGVKNDGVVVGQAVSEKTVREVSQSISENIEPKIYPKVRGKEIGGKACVVVNFEGAEAPYFAFGRAYMRVGDENRQLSAKELEKIFLRKNRERLKWDSLPSEYKLKDINENLLRQYIERANIAGRISFSFDNKESILKKLGLIRDKKLLKAAEVLFCKKSSLKVQLAVFAGNDKLTFLDIQ